MHTSQDISKYNVDVLPLGSVMPFNPGEVPDNWLAFEGQLIFEHWYPELYESVMSSDETKDIFKYMGGKIHETSPGNAITLPYVASDRQANLMAWGSSAVNLKPVPMRIAIKAKSNE